MNARGRANYGREFTQPRNHNCAEPRARRVVFVTDIVRSLSTIGSAFQEYFVSRVGGEEFRSQFADWAGHNCANMDYLTREQWQLAQSLLNVSGRIATGLYR